MTPECRNDCVRPLRFPQRPHNRPGLAHLDYRIGTSADFREALLRQLNQDPVLMAWTHRDADDPGIALLEGAAILGDILTFYQELYANEAYLRTAQWRESIADLVRLLGYQLSPGLGGKGTFAFEVKGDRPVVIPKGFPLQAQVKGLEEQADFQSVAEATAYPWLSKFHLYRRLFTPPIVQGTDEFYIYSPDPETQPVALEKGNRLLIGTANPASNPTSLAGPEIVVIDSVRELHGRKLYKIKGSLRRAGSASALAGLKLGRSFRHFGHNAPKQYTTLNADGTAQQQDIRYVRYVDQTNPPFNDILSDGGVYVVEPTVGATELPLDSEVNDLASGNRFLIQGRFLEQQGGQLQGIEYTHVCTITGVKARSMTWGALSGATTVVTVANQIFIAGGGHYYHLADIRELQFHEVLSPVLELRAAVQETTEASGSDLYFLGTDAEAQTLKGRGLLLDRPGAELLSAQVTDVQSLSAAVAGRRLTRRVTLNKEVSYADFPNEKPTVTVYGNLVEATQGKSEREAPLGNGDSRQAFQTFKLPKAPLTYLHSPGETPPEVPELQIYVNDRLWRRAPSLFNRGPKEEVYIVREDVNGDSWVQFGDGKNAGARLPSGLENVVARFRTGTGTHGPLKEGTSVQAGGRLDRLDKVRLPGVVSGGSAPETGANARAAAPGKVQSLDRLVSLQDFDSETQALAGVSRVAAAWALVDNVPAVVLTVLMKTGRDAEITQVRQIVAHANRCRGPQRFPVIVNQGHLQYLFLDVHCVLDPVYREERVRDAVKEALGVIGAEGNGVDGSAGLLALTRRRFGDKEYACRIEGIVQNVPGVLWARVNGLGSLGTAADPLTLVPPAAPWPLQNVVACAAENILQLHNAHLQLSVVAAPGKECL